MSDDPTRTPSDAELDRLLGSQPRRTSPDFELRWRELRATLGRREPDRARWRPAWIWPGFAVAALAAVLALTSRVRSPEPAPNLAVFEELITLDATLARATPLLDAENRDAILYLPAQPRL